MKLELLIFAFFIHTFLLAQEQPCIDPKRPKYATGPHSKTSPIFPGCESFRENNDSLNRCFGKKIGHLIADKLERKYGVEISDSLPSYRNKLSILIDSKGKLKLKFLNSFNTSFETKLMEKLREISEEFVVIPAKYEGNYCAPFIYTLPLAIGLSEEEKSH